MIRLFKKQPSILKIVNARIIYEFSTETQASNKNEEKKIPVKHFLRYELSQNPEFDKAFPNLAKYKKPTTIKDRKEELDFINSLEYSQKSMGTMNLEKTIHQNFKQFEEGYKSPSGPLKWMSEGEKEKIHVLIDEKLQELEDTGLSREELLYDNTENKGLPLIDDPFFQYIKRNNLAREMLLSGGEEFSVEKVVELALRQDIGPDPSVSNSKKTFLFENEVDDNTYMKLTANEIKDKERFDPKSYFGLETNPQTENLRELLDKDKKYHYIPLSRSQKRRKNLKPVDEFDIHWRNSELLCKYLNPSGKIKHRFQTRLPSDQHRKVAKTIKLAREMLLIPYVGYISSIHRRSLRTLQEDIEDHTRKVVNIETGALFLREEIPRENESQKFYEDYVKEQSSKNLDEKRFLSIKDLEFEYLPPIPTNEELTLLEGELFAKHLKEKELIRKGVDPDKLREIKDEVVSLRQNLVETPDVRIQNYKRNYNIDIVTMESSFKKMEEKVKNSDANRFADYFFAEKAYDSTHFEKLEQEKKIGAKVSSKNLEECVKLVEELKREFKIEGAPQIDSTLFDIEDLGDENSEYADLIKSSKKRTESQILKKFLSTH